jgi:RHS repeat-associated protein
LFGETFVEERNTEQDLIPYLFTSKELDPMTGLYYYGARYYNPKGPPPFLSVDPLADKYPEWSAYAYCGNNPINYVDIEGMYKLKFNAQSSQKAAVSMYGKYENQTVSDIYRKNGEWVYTVSISSSTYTISNIKEYRTLLKNRQELGIKRNYSCQLPPSPDLSGSSEAVGVLIELLGDPLPGVPGTDIGFTAQLQQLLDNMDNSTTTEALTVPIVVETVPNQNENTTSTANQNGTYRKIVWGDTLSEIAVDEGTTVKELQRLNPDKIKNPNKIYAGDDIKTN